MRVYVASPLGFSAAGRLFLQELEAHLARQGHEILSPWDDPDVAAAIDRDAPHDELVNLIGSRNVARIRAAEAVVASLDGMEPDSGTASEVGYAAGLGKPVFAIRTDFRPCGDFAGMPLNVQLLYFIQSSGGRLYSRIQDLVLPWMDRQS